MALEFTFKLSEEEARKTLAKKLEYDKLLELILINTETYKSWDVELNLAEALVKQVKENYIDKYREDDIPEVLRPLLIQAISDNILKENEANKNITLEEVSDETELEAIKVLRKYSTIDYKDAINIFFEGYDFAIENSQNNLDLSEVSTEDLLNEIKNRI